MDGALASIPDAIGLISWNEFSENSHVEPSRKYGLRYLHVLADIRGTKVVPAIPDFNSDEAPAGRSRYGTTVLAGISALAAVFFVALLLRRRSAQGRPGARGTS